MLTPKQDFELCRQNRMGLRKLRIVNPRRYDQIKSVLGRDPLDTYKEMVLAGERLFTRTEEEVVDAFLNRSLHRSKIIEIFELQFYRFILRKDTDAKEKTVNLLLKPPFATTKHIYSLIFTKKHYDRVIEPTIADCEREAFEALDQGKGWKGTCF